MTTKPSPARLADDIMSTPGAVPIFFGVLILIILIVSMAKLQNRLEIATPDQLGSLSSCEASAVEATLKARAPNSQSLPMAVIGDIESAKAYCTQQSAMRK